MAKGGKKSGSGAAKSASAATAKAQEDVWAQCDNPNCQKWRRLPPGTVIDEDTPWYCYMNPDEEKAACEAPEESYKLDVEIDPGFGEAEYKAPSSSRHVPNKSKSRSHADRSKAASKSLRQTSWPTAHRSNSGSSSQGTKRAESALDPPFEAQRTRLGSSSSSRLYPQAEANVHDLDYKPKANRDGDAHASELHGSSLGGVRHSLRPKRPPSLPLKEESPPPPGPPRHQSRQGGSRPPSGQNAAAQAAAMRPTQKARKQHKGFEKLLALGGLWEIVKGKGKAITPPPFWVWEGLATHTPAAAELAAQAADVASAARYFEGGNFPSGAAQAAEAAALKRQAMTAAAMLGLDVTSQIPDVIPRAQVSKPQNPPAAAAVTAAAQAAAPSAVVAALKPEQPAGVQSPQPTSPSGMPGQGRPHSLSQILSQTQPQALTHPQPQVSSQSQVRLPPPSQALSHGQSHAQSHGQSRAQTLTRPPMQNPAVANVPAAQPSAATQSASTLASLAAMLPSQQQLVSQQALQMQHQQHPDSQLLARLPGYQQQHHPQQLQQQIPPQQSSQPDAGQLQLRHPLQQTEHQSVSAIQTDALDGSFARQPSQQQLQSSALTQHQDRQSLHPNGQSQHSQESDQHQTFVPLDRQNGLAGGHDGNDAVHSCSWKQQQDQLQRQSMLESSVQSQKGSPPPQTAVAGIAERSGSASVQRQ